MPLPLLPLLLAAQLQIGQPPRLRTMLPNGIVVLVERRPGAKDLYVDLFAATRGTDETPATHGRRHLLEHIQALGTKGDLDVRVETAGGFLTAQTTRDAIAFDMSLPSNGLAVGLSAIKEIVTGPPLDAKAIAREANLIAEEGAMRTTASLASSVAWEEAFGPRGLDPFGDMETIQATKPDELEKLRKATFAAGNLVIVVSGDVDLDATTNAVKDALSFLPSIKPVKSTLPSFPEAAPGSGVVAGAGEYRAASVSGFRVPATAATLAAALALANGLEHSEVIYTPSVRPGLILLGVSEGTMGAAVSQADASELFELGRRLAIRWVQTRLADPGEAAAFRGVLMSQAIDVRPETMLENLQALNFVDFQRAIEAFKSKQILVEGKS